MKMKIRKIMYLILFTLGWVVLLSLFQEFYRNWQGHIIRSIYIMTATLPLYGYIAHRILLQTKNERNEDLTNEK